MTDTATRTTSTTRTSKSGASQAKGSGRSGTAASRDASVVLEVLGAGPRGLIIAEPDGRVVWLSTEATRLLNLLTQPLAVGQAVSEVALFEGLLDATTAHHRVVDGPAGTQIAISAHRATSPDGSPIGIQLELEDATERLAQERAADRLASMVENAPINMMFTDRDLILEYMNPASLRTLTGIEEHLPVKASEAQGNAIDIFHKHPEHQRRLLGDPSNLPHRATFSLGPETLDLLVTAIFDRHGEHIGAMATWDVVTEQVAILDVIEAAANGD
ncbi:MAG: hypothetical protein ACLFRV_15440, partial [Acidimicrobiales bacterium]